MKQIILIISLCIASYLLASSLDLTPNYEKKEITIVDE